MNRGFIGTLFLIIVGLALLKYFFDWSIFDAAATEEGRATIDYIRKILNAIWSILAVPATFIWNEIFVPVFEILVGRLRQ
jgi:hypothetical protein